MSFYNVALIEALLLLASIIPWRILRLSASSSALHYQSSFVVCVHRTQAPKPRLLVPELELACDDDNDQPK
jgi:hypothetical protein